MQEKITSCLCEEAGFAQCRCLPAERCSSCGFSTCACDAYENNAYQRMQAAIARLDLPDTVILALERAIDKVEDSPLYHLAQSWAINPLADFDRPTLSPLQAEGIGRWMAIHLARVMGSRLAVLSSDVTF